MDLTVGDKTMSLSAALPSVPGHYRLTITLHDGDGVAYDAASRRSSGPSSSGSPASSRRARRRPERHLRRRHDGPAPGRGRQPRDLAVGPGGHGHRSASAASIIGHWVALDLIAPGVPPDVSADLAPGRPTSGRHGPSHCRADVVGEDSSVPHIVTPETAWLACGRRHRPDAHPPPRRPPGWRYWPNGKPYHGRKYPRSRRGTTGTCPCSAPARDPHPFSTRPRPRPGRGRGTDRGLPDDVAAEPCHARWGHDPPRHGVLDGPDDDRRRGLLPRAPTPPRSGSATTPSASRWSRSMRPTTRCRPGGPPSCGSSARRRTSRSTSRRMR